MTACDRNPPQAAETLPAFRIAEMIMTIDEAATARQAPQRIFQKGIIALVRNQPESGEGL